MKRKLIKFLLCVVVAVSVISASFSVFAVEFDPYMQTGSFSTYIEVYDNNTYRVTETIEVSFLTERHGIYRYIPVVQNVNGQAKRIKITDIDVENETYETYSENGNKVIQIGDADYTVSGNKTYKISYTVKNRDDGNDEYDEFYYNVLPHGWQTSIDKAFVTVNFETKNGKAPDLSKFELYSGSYGESGDEKFESRAQGNIIFANSVAPLECNEGATLRVKLPDDYFSGEEKNPLLSAIIVLVAIAVAAIVILLKLRFGRKKDVIPVVNFYPPEDMTSADIGYVLDGIVDSKDIVSLIIYWADKGYLLISEEKKEIRLTKLKDISQNATSYEKDMFLALFNGRETVTTAELKESFYKSIEDAKIGISHHYTSSKDRKIFKPSSTVAGIFACLLSAIPMAMLVFAGFSIKIVSELAIAAGVIGTIMTIFALIFLTILNFKKNAMSKTSFIVSRFFAVCVFAIALAVSAAVGFLMFKMPVETMVSLLSAVVCSYIAVDMRTLTERGCKLTGEILGFKEFIKTAELDKLNALVLENPQYFYSVLPYAYVMGLSDKWAKKFETIAIEPPEWYNGYSGSTFNTFLFMNSFSRSINNLQTNMVSVPQSKGGGKIGGGGFSGGGFGGGGGGSW